MMTEDECLIERFRIRELIARYLDALNHRDWNTYAACWTEDATFQMLYETVEDEPEREMSQTDRPVNLRAIGRDEILRLVAGYNRNPWLIQLAHPAVVELLGDDVARSRHAMSVHSHAMTLFGLCYDSFAKDNEGNWRFSARDYRPTYFEPARHAGIVTRKLPSANYHSLPEQWSCAGFRPSPEADTQRTGS